jgi:non-ribosomal peptide synthase protein (TIGR01720 family)
VTERVQRERDLWSDPMLRAGLVRGAGLLVLDVHHLVMDGVSWNILLEDLETGYAQAVRGEAVDFGHRTTSYRDWSLKLADHVAGGSLDGETEHWLAAVGPGTAESGVTEDDTVGAQRTVSVELSIEHTETLVYKAPAVFRSRVADVLISALAWSLSRWTGRDRVWVMLESHGRREEIFDGVDLTRTIGWFTSVYPVSLDLPVTPGPSWPDLVRSVRGQLRKVPGQGLGYGALRYLSRPGTPGAALADRSEPQVLFNYHGRFQDQAGVLCRARRPGIGGDYSEAERVTRALDIDGSIYADRLGFSWYYSPSRYAPATVEAVAEDFRTAMVRIAEWCEEKG